MINLLEETLAFMKDEGLDPKEIIFIGSKDQEYGCTFDQFKKTADLKYDNGYGCPEVCTDLIIVFKDGSKMWRRECDGAEWWYCHKPLSIIENNYKPIKTIVGGAWNTVKEMNQ